MPDQDDLIIEAYGTFTPAETEPEPEPDDEPDDEPEEDI